MKEKDQKHSEMRCLRILHVRKEECRRFVRWIG